MPNLSVETPSLDVVKPSPSLVPERATSSPGAVPDVTKAISSQFGGQDPSLHAVHAGATNDFGRNHEVNRPNELSAGRTLERSPERVQERSIASEPAIDQKPGAQDGLKPLEAPRANMLDNVTSWAKQNPILASAAAAAVMYLVQSLLAKNAGIGSGGSILGSLGMAGAGALAIKAWDTFGSKNDPRASAVQENVATVMARDPKVAKLVTDHPEIMTVAKKNPEVLNNLIQNPAGVESMLKNPDQVTQLVKSYGEPGSNMKFAVAAIPTVGTPLAGMMAAKESSMSRASIEKELSLAVSQNPAFAQVVQKNPLVLDAVRENPILLKTVLQDGMKTQAFFSDPESVKNLFMKREEPGAWDKLKAGVLSAFSPAAAGASLARAQVAGAERAQVEAQKILGDKVLPPAVAQANSSTSSTRG